MCRKLSTDGAELGGSPNSFRSLTSLRRAQPDGRTQPADGLSTDPGRWQHDKFEEAPADLRSRLRRGDDLRRTLGGAAKLAPASRRSTELTVPRLLESLGLEQYAPVFVAEEVDLAALALCTDADLKQMGLPLGPRKKLLAMVQMRR